MKKKKIILFVCFTCCAMFINAASVSILLCQKDKTQTEIRNMSNEFEEKIMDYLFDYGHIVSNGATIIDQDEKTSYQIAVDETMEGYFDYLVYFTMNYSDIPSTNPKSLIMEDISEVDWTVLRIVDNSIISEGNAKPKLSANNKAEVDLSVFAKQIALQLDKSLTN